MGLRAWWGAIWFRVSSFFLFPKELSIAVIGLQNSGKTTFTNLLGGKSFEADTIPTLGIQINRFSLGNSLLNVYDLAGQTRFQPLWERCFDKVDLIIYMIDLSDLSCLADAFSKLRQVIRLSNTDRIPLVIIGNKIDLIKDPIDPMAHGEATEKPQANFSLSKYIPDSMLTNYNFDDIETLKLDNSNLYRLKRIDILSKQIGIDVKNHILHVPSSTSDKEHISLNADIAIFTSSCKNGDYIDEITSWITQL